jgi:1,4-alpha-glucan branching enzyme
MLRKSYTKTAKKCRVTFKYPNEENFKTAALAGEFNDWSLEASPMKRLKDGSFSITLSLPAGCSYQFRYVLDGKVWVNDLAADSYAPNEYFEDNSVVVV